MGCPWIPGVPRSVSPEFIIGGDGKVAFVLDAGCVACDPLDTCIEGVLRGLQFPAHQGDDINVTYCLNFDPG